MENSNPSGADRVSAIRDLCRSAFREHSVEALWSMREPADPTPGEALAIAHALRHNGNLRARALAERIEELCRGLA